MYQNLHFYIDFDWEKHVDDKSYFPKIYKIIQLAYQHKTSVFYSQKQIQDFVNNYQEFDEYFSQSFGNELSVLLENASSKENNRYAFETCFSGEKTSLNPIKNYAISVINSYSKNALISSTQNSEDKVLLSVESSVDFEKVNFRVINNTDNLLQWIQNNSVERIFNLSAKHGENGLGNWTNASKLRCNKEEAQQLLNTAIPDFIEKEKQLFNFDETHQTFIVFFYEGDTPQNQWHGFHIEESEWEKEIPQSIRKYFAKT